MAIMETSSGSNPDTPTNPSSTATSTSICSNSKSYRYQFPGLSFLRSLVSTMLEYFGILRPRPNNQESETLTSVVTELGRIVQDGVMEGGGNDGRRGFAPAELTYVGGIGIWVYPTPPSSQKGMTWASLDGRYEKGQE